MSSTCTYTLAMLASGAEPPPGSCLGPQDRTAARRAAMSSSACGVGKVTFAVDGSASATSCGDCVPGQTFLEDGACVIGQFCNDNGYCSNVSTSALWLQQCAFELGAHSSLGQCGPGLRCYSNRCVECLPGVDAVPGTLWCTPEGLYAVITPFASTASLCTRPSSWASWDLFSTPAATSHTLVIAFAIAVVLGRLFTLMSWCCRDAPPTEDALVPPRFESDIARAVDAEMPPENEQELPAARDPFAAPPLHFAVAPPLRMLTPTPQQQRNSIPPRLRRSSSSTSPIADRTLASLVDTTQSTVQSFVARYRSPVTRPHAPVETLPSWRDTEPVVSPRRTLMAVATTLHATSDRDTPTMPRRNYRPAAHH